MASPSPAPPIDPEQEQDELGGVQDADLPLTMAASVVLANLPKDAHQALETVAKDGEGEKGKICCSYVYPLPSFADCPCYFSLITCRCSCDHGFYLHMNRADITLWAGLGFGAEIV